MRKCLHCVALAIAVLIQTACTPFFHGRVVVFGDPKDEPDPAASTSK